MANYNGASRTNYFRVTDEEKYDELFNNLTAEFGIEDFTKNVDGVIWHGFGAYSSIDYLYKDDSEEYDEDEDYEYNFDMFLEELQKILPDNEAFIYMESGHEKLRYVGGSAIICTNKECKSVDLTYFAITTAKEMLGSDFKTQLEY